MFLDRTLERNPELVDLALDLHKKGLVDCDSYLLDLDAMTANADLIASSASKFGIKLFFMSKQIGRNPLVAKRVIERGFEGAVAVDYREAEILAQGGVRIGNLGHLCQIPEGRLAAALGMKSRFVTLFSLEKAASLAAAAASRGIAQRVLLKVVDREKDSIYPGQEGGMDLADLRAAAHELSRLEGIKIAGLTSFPCFLAGQDGRIAATHNAETLRAAAKILKEELGLEGLALDMPSANSADTMGLIAAAGGHYAEPGHALTGTVPGEGHREKPAIVYLTEGAHSGGGKSYAFGGGHYRRSGVKSAAIRDARGSLRRVGVVPPEATNIDYHFELGELLPAGTPLVMAFRTQIFVTRSRVVPIEGLSTGKPRIAGVFDSQGGLVAEGQVI